MTVDFAYKLIQYICNKNQSGSPSPDEFNRIINMASLSHVNYLCGQFQQYLPQRAQPRVSYSENRTVRQRLTPFIYGRVLSVDNTGLSPYPFDYLQMDAMWGIYGYTRIRYTQQNQIDSFANSEIDPVADNPIYWIEDQGFRFLPSDLGSAKLSYVRQPNTIVWASIYGANQRPIYDTGNSIDPEWDDLEMLEVIARALRMVGVNLQAADISQYANEVKQGGQ